MNKHSFYLLPIMFFILHSSIFAQDDDEKFFEYEVKISNNYFWRGQQLDNRPNIQPEINLNFDYFTFGTWMSQSLWNNYKELDLYLIFYYKNFSFSLYDYFSLQKGDDGSYSDYFVWEKGETYHTLEGIIEWEGEKLPLKLLAAISFYGDDIDDFNKQFYSTYFQGTYTLETSIADIDFFVGGTANEGEYADNAAFTNLGIELKRDFKLYKNNKLQIWGMTGFNPADNQFLYSFGISFFN